MAPADGFQGAAVAAAMVARPAGAWAHGGLARASPDAWRGVERTDRGWASVVRVRVAGQSLKVVADGRCDPRESRQGARREGVSQLPVTFLRSDSQNDGRFGGVTSAPRSTIAWRRASPGEALSPCSAARSASAV
jgi:hypothetical protein